ncbi:hypothetical protein PENANT_c021G02264 [Penicillium antarcticum]|uniref:Uncharacterized protein n=1 Tax=Penicillium antarcticum TaxID=416450 RepID=A0A1V6Q0K0_9EURO|nr:uncharacterized protein N7508_010854 [Penicillium antarcticum]KAJ5296033.1 hypothetical protein N7508_010854 [Penicillium antarcticum]OQD82402.1 hypothetical protein PENANT_c021G02264 [Penicillium antarcticum]
MSAATDDMHTAEFAVLTDLFSDNIAAQNAAETLASIQLSGTTEPESNISSLWSFIIKCAYEFPEHQTKLVDTLVQLSKLPDAKAANGDPILLYDMRVWKDLPMLGWQFREEWNASIPTGPSDQRANAISRMINRDKFTALLMATKEPVFNYSWFALITFREALEEPETQKAGRLDGLIPVAATWIQILGAEIYTWNEDFGRRGRGGSLWHGKEGFCVERWHLWRERFGEMAKMEELDDGARRAAGDAEQIMRKIESQPQS